LCIFAQEWIVADFNWNDLRAFLAVARSGRLTSAAARVGMDHTTVARRIAALEEGLGARLFDRSPQGYALTPHGERLMPTAEKIESLTLLAANEPALRIVATLCGQIRGWLWVSLLDQQGESDVNAIAKAAGIGNPKRIYVMRKQIRGRPPARFLLLLRQLLEVEAALKRGSEPGDAFRDGFLLTA
jgi:hypothetical protein